MPSIACVNGVYSAPEDARVPIDDRGYVFGDAIYETLRCYGGRVWALERHLARFRRSLSEVAIRTDVVEMVRPWIDEAVRRSELPEATVYVQVSRGVAPRQHTFDSSLRPTVVVTVRPAEAISDEVRSRGVDCVTAEDIRWARRDIKSTNLLGNVLLKQAAHDKGAFEAILVEPGGRVTEGSSTNVFVVRNGRAWTAPTDHHILGGITRDLVLDLAREIGIPTVEEVFNEAELKAADEVFISGTLTEVLGVVTLDGQPVGSGCVGPITKRLYAAYQDRVVKVRDF